MIRGVEQYAKDFLLCSIFKVSIWRLKTRDSVVEIQVEYSWDFTRMGKETMEATYIIQYYIL